jgi:glycerate kinase
VKILIGVDSFKDCLSAKAVSECIAKGLKFVSDDFSIRIVPMADGGEGTVESLIDATSGTLKLCQVNDALMRPLEAKFGILGDKETAIIEMAAASGIEHLDKAERNPYFTSTFGTGELIRQALDSGCRRIIIGIGGSATNDGGVGMAMALGVKFFNKNGDSIEKGGGDIANLVRIDSSEIDKRIAQTEFVVACDVTNPLTGTEGASFVYGPQKGADAKMVRLLDDNLAHLAKVIKRDLNIGVENVAGAGAAGGLGAGLLAFCNGNLQSGFDIVAHETHLKEHCAWADVVLTGEGKIDRQTKFGKTPQGVATIAKQFHKPVVALAGTLGYGYQELYNSGFDAIFSIVDSPMPLSEALLNASDLLFNSGVAIGKMLLFPSKC